ncbi:hypothetical protein ABBQ38_006782 [Trebouxia sp. C0009 RCD-2024]
MVCKAWGWMVLAPFLLHLGWAAEKYIEDADRFPGWKGELPHDKTSQPGQPKVVELAFGEHGKDKWRGEVVELSWEPRAFLFKKFMTDEECDSIIAKAKPSMTKSSVVDNETGKSIDSTVRTSTGTFFARGQDPVLAAVEKRIAQVSHIPEENGEGMQVLHYVNGQKYEPHHDYFHDTVNPQKSNGGQRVATMLMYLTTVEEGGETVFPNSAEKVVGDQWSDCAKRGLAVKTQKGDALLFFSLKPDGEVDPSSLHGSCATTKGEKWSATKWMHVGSFGLSAEAQKAKWGDCIDGDTKCGEWAALGECTKNPAYMMSTCKKACKACSNKGTSTAKSHH